MTMSMSSLIIAGRKFCALEQQKMSRNLLPKNQKMSELDLLQQDQNNTWEKIKEIISFKGIPVNKEWLDYAILNRALECGKKDIAKLLLDKKCRVNRIEYIPHNTPLHNAVMLEDVELVSKLLEKGASITALNSAGNSPLHFAFKYRQEHIVDRMLSHVLQTSNYANPKNCQGLSHLHIASTRKHQKLVMNFLEAGADVSEAINADSPLWPGYTAMHFAVKFGSLDAAKVLQQAKGDVLKNSCEKAAEDLAYDKVHESSIVAHVLGLENCEFSISNPFNTQNPYLDPGLYTFPSYFHLACMRKNPNIVEKFIKSGAKINTPISKNAVFCPLYTPLHFAVESNCADNVKILLKHGADVKRKDGYDMTPLHLALYNEDISEKTGIVNKLYRALKNKEEYCEDKNGMTYMHIGCTRNDVSLVKHCLDQRLQDVNARIQRNPRKFSLYTPLHFAVRYRAFEVAKFLVEREGSRANVNTHDDGESGTPLHLACQMGHAGMIDLLLRNGARANVIRTKDRKTPIHLLVESFMDQREARELVENFDLNGFDDVQSAKYDLEPFIETLVELGANVNAKDKDNDTALHIACSNFWDGSECAKRLITVGADINLEDANGETAFSMALSTCRESYNELAVLYHHVQKLKTLGLKVNPKNDQFCENFLKDRVEWFDLYDDIKDVALAKMELQRLEEIEKMKMLSIGEGTFLDFVVCDAKRLKKYAQNEVVKAIMECKDLTTEFPQFAFWIKLQYQRALKSLEGSRKRGASGEGGSAKRNRTE